MASFVTMADRAMKKAVKEIGGVSKTARELGVFRASVYWALNHGCPPKFVLKVEELTGNKVSRYELRPDIYGPAP